MTNFFQTLVDLKVQGDWNILIAKEENERIVVSVLFFNNAVGDSAKMKVPPMILKGTPEEMDQVFFSKITEPVKQTDSLFTSMEHFLKQKENAKLSSQMEKDKKVKTEKIKDKYAEGMALVDQLDQEGRPRDAWMKLPDPRIFPEHAEEIKKRRSELSAKFSPNLFND